MALKEKLIHHMLQATVEKYPSRIAVTHGQRKYSYSDILDKSNRLAAFLLEKGIRIGDRVCLVLDNSPEYIVAYFATLKVGGIVVPLSDQMTSRGIRKIVSDSGAKVMFIRNKVIGILREAIFGGSTVDFVLSTENGELWASPPLKEINRNNNGYEHFDFAHVVQDVAFKPEETFPILQENFTAMILYTSGTTGVPKGVMLSHRNLYTNADSIVRYLRLTDIDSVMVVLPFYYSYGNSLLTTHVMVGGGLVLENSFLYPNTVLDRMAEEKVTGIAGVPSTFAILLNRSNLRSRRFPCLRYATQAGGAMPPKHAHELSDALPGTEIFVMYGQTEATARLTYLEPTELKRKAGSIGKAISGVRISLKKEDGTEASQGETGEIVAEGDNIMQGYWSRPEETANVIQQDGLHTGDLARIDDEGYLFIVGRKSDMIKSGAHRISAKEIEETLMELQQIHEVAVVGVPDEILGEAICAHVVLKPGTNIDRNGVMRHCAGILPPYKLPKQIIFVEALPKTDTGKIRKHEIRQA